MSKNRIVNGKIAAILAYGFSGKSPYHFSRIYFNPCAISIASGNMKNTIASGLKPVMTNVKTRSSIAIELREAKKPFVVENNPIKARASVGNPINGAKNTLSTEPFQRNTGDNPLLILIDD